MKKCEACNGLGFIETHNLEDFIPQLNKCLQRCACNRLEKGPNIKEQISKFIDAGALKWRDGTAFQTREAERYRSFLAGGDKIAPMLLETILALQRICAIDDWRNDRAVEIAQPVINGIKEKLK